MSGDWIKIEVCLPDKPEVWAMSEALKLDPDAVVGKLIRVWAWFDAHTDDGNANRVTCAFIDRIISHQNFAKAMIDVGWLHQNDAGLMQPKFEKHNGESAKKRAEAAQRQAIYRKKKARNAKSVTKVLPEKRREEKSILKEKKNTTSTATRFDAWWKAYPKKIEKKKALEIWKRRKLDRIADIIIADTEQRPTACEKWKAGYIPNPTTYLNGDRWDDEYETNRSQQNGNSQRETPVQRRNREAREAIAELDGHA